MATLSNSLVDFIVLRNGKSRSSVRQQLHKCQDAVVGSVVTSKGGLANLYDLETLLEYFYHKIETVDPRTPKNNLEVWQDYIDYIEAYLAENGDDLY